MARRLPGSSVRDAAAGSIALVLAGAYWVGATAIRSSPLVGKGVGASALPKGLAIALACFSTALILKSIWAWRRAVADERPSRTLAEAVRPHLRAAGMLLIGILFLAILDSFGYVLSLILLLATTALYSGQPPSKGLVFFSLAISAAYYLLFVQLLGIALPPGIWPSLWADIAGSFM